MSQNKYKVKVIQILLKNNKLAKAGDVVSESQLMRNAKDLVKEKFIEPVDAKSTTDEDEKAQKEAFEKAYKEGSLDAKQLDTISKAEISKYADEHEWKHDASAKKAELIEQVLKGEKSKE